MALINSTIPLLDSAGQPANGAIYWQQSARYTVAEGIVTTTKGRAKVLNGVISNATGGPLRIPETPSDQSVQLVEDLGGSVIQWVTQIPAGEEVEYSDLPQIIPPTVGGGVPAWVTDLLAVPALAQAAEAGAIAAQEAAEVARVAAEAAASGAVGATDAGMTSIAEDTGSDFRASLNATIGTVTAPLIADEVTRADALYAQIIVSDTAPEVSGPKLLWLKPAPVIDPGDTTPPAVPTVHSPLILSQSAIFAWDAVTAVDLSHYEYRISSGSPVSVGTVLSTRVDALANGTAYTFQVRSVDTNTNASEWSTAVTFTPIALGNVFASRPNAIEFDPAVLSAANGASVASLTPRVGASLATALAVPSGSVAPTMLTGAVNGHPALAFDATLTQALQAAGINLAQPFTTLMAFDVSTANGYVLTNASATVYAALKARSDGTALSVTSSGTGATISNGTYSVTTHPYTIVGIVWDGASSRVYRQAQTSATFVTGALAEITALRLFRDGVSTHTTGHLARLGIEHAALSDADMKAAMLDWGTYFGLTIGA